MKTKYPLAELTQYYIQKFHKMISKEIKWLGFALHIQIEVQVKEYVQTPPEYASSGLPYKIRKEDYPDWRIEGWE